MMTKLLYRKTFVILLIIAFVACEKETVDTEKTDPVAEETIETLVGLANKRYMEKEATIADEVDNTAGESGGLIDEYAATHEAFTTNRIQKNGFLSCLVSVTPDREQRQLIGRALSTYSSRNERIIQSYRQEIQNLNQRMENARGELYEKFRNGEIDRNQLFRRLEVLNERYREAVYDKRNSSAEAFSRSYAILLGQLNGILDTFQWRGFTACLSS
jgi:hypothetical protein